MPRVSPDLGCGAGAMGILFHAGMRAWHRGLEQEADPCGMTTRKAKTKAAETDGVQRHLK
jgi:hypothetical protein